MTTDDLKRLALAATPGPWKASDFVQAPATDKAPAIHTKKIRPLQKTALGSFTAADADYIAAVSPDVILSLLSENERMRGALEELHTMVWGECPSLLNEDSGGNAKLDLEIRDLLTSGKKGNGK